MISIFDCNDWPLWTEKYIHPMAYSENKNIMIEEVGPDIIQFPLFTEEFCDELISFLKTKKNTTNQITDYNEISIMDLGLFEAYQKAFIDYIHPYIYEHWRLASDTYWSIGHTFISKFDDQLKSNLGFHHDESMVTLNVLLSDSDDFEGGGTFFKKCNKTISPKKKGWVIAHPGSITHLHSVKPIESGTRYNLVSYLLDETIINKIKK
ncbi:hypothetical protein [Aquimarina algiphila]|uniref:hypothetical protein n=1 Tax=Aquimarina algiphila TaxID=2047982 RepID=UPI00232E5D6B|nr:hypothetical protein [Aquimarina algiphila]